MNKKNIILVGSLVAIGVLAIFLLKSPKETPERRVRKLKEDSDKRLLDLQLKRSLSSNFDEIVKIDIEIDSIKNKLRNAGVTDILTEMKTSDDLSLALNKNKI